MRTSYLHLSRLLPLPLVAGLAACTPADLVAPPAAGAAELREFGSCDELLGYLQEHALERVGPWGLGDGGHGGWAESTDDAAMADSAEAADVDLASAPQEGTDFSGTNNQEQGVEEPDVVQTDGRVIVTVSGGRLVVVDAERADRVGEVRLPRGGSGDSELLLDRESRRALVLTREWGGGPAGATVDGLRTFPAFEAERTVLTLVDLADAAAPEVVGSLRLEGGYRSARMHDGSARVVLVTQPPGLAFAQPRNSGLTAESEAQEANRRIIEESTIEDWLPHLQPLGPGSGSPELAVGCDDVARPAEFSGLSTLSVLTLDLAGDPRPTSATGLVATGSTVYASTDRLVVATSPWDAWGWGGEGGLLPGTGEGVSTALHTFDLSQDGSTDYVASGRVEGRMLDQFALDETDGTIRVATTTDLGNAEPSSSSLVVLEEEGRALVERGRVDDLGVTERIYAVRYLSPGLAAVVTFRETDPLYLVDTSDPAAPAVAGELKIPGYSAYLHPVGEGLLLGLGQDATEGGQTTGLQLSLFDISDPAEPTRVSQVHWKDHYSQAEHDHRAFLHWPSTGQVVLPAESWAEDTGWTGVTSATLAGRSLAHGPSLQLGGGDSGTWDYPRRSLVVGDRLWVLGESSLRAVDLQTFEEQARVNL